MIQNSIDPFDDADVDPLADVREKFIASLPEWRGQAEQHLERQDVDALRSHCHRIKGTAGVLGCFPLSKSGGAAESALRSVPPGSCVPAEALEAVSAIFALIDELVPKEHQTDS